MTTYTMLHCGSIHLIPLEPITFIICDDIKTGTELQFALKIFHKDRTAPNPLPFTFNERLTRDTMCRALTIAIDKLNKKRRAKRRRVVSSEEE